MVRAATPCRILKVGAGPFRTLLRERPDICLLDVAMPRMTGLQATVEIRAHAPEISILVLSMHDDERYLYEALQAGAAGYVLKREADTVLVDACGQLQGLLLVVLHQQPAGVLVERLVLLEELAVGGADDAPGLATVQHQIAVPTLQRQADPLGDPEHDHR